MNTKADKFFKVVYDIYGTYLDSIMGYYHFRNFLIYSQGKNPPPDIDNRKFTYGKGNPGEVGSYKLQESTQGEVKERNKDEGKNDQIIGNLCLVSIYGYWEYFRGKIAEEKGISINDIKSDLMADIAKIRHSILKHDSVGNEKMKRCKILKWFKEGEKIYIDQRKMEEVVFFIRKFVDELNREYYS